MWPNVFGLHIADQQVTMLVFDQLVVELHRFLKFEGGYLTDNHMEHYLSKSEKLMFYISPNNIQNIGFWSFGVCNIFVPISMSISYS